jgi:hypothetical protein
MPKSVQIPRPVAVIQAELDAAKKPGSHEQNLGADPRRIGDQFRLLGELRSAQEYWTKEEVAQSAAERARERSQVRASLPPEVRARFDRLCPQ